MPARRGAGAFGLWLIALVVTLVTYEANAMDVPPKPQGAIRFATYNVALHGDVAPREVIARLAFGWRKARLSAEVIQRVRPDVLVLQEVDRDEGGEALSLYADAYLGRPQEDQAPIHYTYRVLLPTNTGVPTGIDLNADGVVGTEEFAYARDARGFGQFPGQYAFSVLSRLPVTSVRTFTQFLWRDMPDARLPATLSDEAKGALPLSSKTHAIVEFVTPSGPIHIIAAHPTPPIETDTNVARNADEIRLVADLLSEATSSYAADDEGRTGGLPEGTPALVMGDLNADPNKGDSAQGAILQVLDHPRINPIEPRAPQGSDTARFNRGMRVDYVLPTRELEVVGSGVYWPDEDGPLDRLNEASDHRLVWVDVRLP